MATKDFKLAVFAWLPTRGFSPAGLLTLSETIGANQQNRELTSGFAYGLGYVARAESIEVDPVSLGLADREAIRGRALFPVNGLGEFGGIRDAAPDAWGRRVIEARRKVPANSLPEAEYLLAAGGDRVGALDVRQDIKTPDSPSASDLQSLEYILQAAEAVDSGMPVPANLEPFLAAGPSAGGARPKASVRDEHGALWLAKFPAQGDVFDVARSEMCTLELARRCGLTVPEVRYIMVGQRPVMLIRRFDRYWALPGMLPDANIAMHDSRPGDGLVEGRLHLVSGLTLVACSKFESRTKGYHDLAAAIRKFVHTDFIATNCEELFARMVFNIFVSNDDDHLRNHAFVRDPRSGGWALSPLYDVVPRPGVAYERQLHLEVGAQGKLATLDNALSYFSAFVPERARAMDIIRRIWTELREWRTCFEASGADGHLLSKLEGAFRKLEDIAQSDLAKEIRKGA
ncbi:MAG: type II toxin-antitoxin system HipA family toxin [Trinickia sp.]